MLFLSGNNNLAFFVFLYLGLIIGLVYEVSVFACKIVKNNIILRNILDIIVVLFGGIAFIIALNKVAFGYFRVYLLVTFLLGFVLERASIGFLVAKVCEFVYNKTINLLKLIWRKRNDSRKAKNNS